MLKKIELKIESQSVINKKIRDLVDEANQINSTKKLSKYIAQIPQDFNLDRETVLYRVENILQDGGSLILLNYAVLYPFLFKFIVEHSTHEVLEEAILFQEILMNANTLTVISGHVNDYVTFDNGNIFDAFLNKISIAVLNEALNSINGGGVRSFIQCIPVDDDLQKDNMFFNAILKKITQENIDNFLFSPIEPDDDMTLFQALLENMFSKDDKKTFLSLLKMVSAKALNDYLLLPENTDLFALMDVFEKSEIHSIIDVLSRKIFQETLETIILRNFDIFIVWLMMSKKLRIKFPDDVNTETNANAAEWLMLMSDQLILKLAHELVIRDMGDNAHVVTFSLLAEANPRFFNALLKRLSKIEGWEGVYQRIIPHESLLRRLDNVAIKQFMLLHPDFKEKIPAIIEPDDAILDRIQNAYRHYKLKSRYTKIEKEVEYINEIF